MTYNIPDHKKGDTFLGLDIEVLVDDVLIDTADYEVKLQVRRSPNKTSPVVLEFSTEAFTIERVEPTSSGVIRLVEQIVDIPAGTYVYDIQFDELSDRGLRKTWLEGTWKITTEVTV
jgi:hypothetical protein